jgi:hypothetical protein
MTGSTASDPRSSERSSRENAWRAVLQSSTAGFVLVRVAGHHDDGAVFIERALNLNVNLARAWLYSAWVRIWLGEPERAIRHHQAMRFSPLDPWLCSMQTAIAFAHFFLARDDEAAFWASEALRVRPHFPPALRVSAASHALAGRSERRWKSWVACDRSIPVCACQPEGSKRPPAPAGVLRQV